MKNILPIKLEKPIAFFDIESTGLDTAKDKIISIAVVKLMPDGSRILKSAIVNPVIPISKEASEIHGFTNDILVDKPKFSQIAKSLQEFMEDCYLAGYNSNFFDCPILQEEFARCGIEFPKYDQLSIDVCSIFKNFEKRDLSSAVKFYCNREMENAHDAQADIDATVDVFLAQLNKYEELKDISVDNLAKIGRNENYVDWQGRIIIDADGEYAWNFGKVKGRKIKNELGFADWVLVNDFPETFKSLIKRIKQEISVKKYNSNDMGLPF
jgi:DNA polymerase-3 subunit epsilon